MRTVVWAARDDRGQLAKEGHEVIIVDRQPVAANETSFASVPALLRRVTRSPGRLPEPRRSSSNPYTATTRLCA
jgi:hypothetical protein